MGKLVRKFFERDIMDSSLNETFVCLIPKKGRTNKVKGFRPISLVTSVCKIIAVSVNRINKVFHPTIFWALIIGRQILDQAHIANEATALELS